MPKRVDDNQKAIVDALRQVGCSVLILAGVGCGCPDLLVGWQGYSILMEIKNLDGRGDRLTPAEAEFMSAWRGGQVEVVHNIDEALDIIGGRNAAKMV